MRHSWIYWSAVVLDFREDLLMACETCLQRVLATALWLRRARNNPFSNLLVAEEAMTVALKEYDRLVKELQ